MLAKTATAHVILNSVAISDKELLTTPSFTIQAFEMCTMCGARFGIGYEGASNDDERAAVETEELPRKLAEILARDHWHDRAHKRHIDLDM